MYTSGTWSGWWEQTAWGRQPMTDFALHFDAGDVTGEGVDVIGQFTVRGHYDDRGSIRFVKHYVGRHAVAYEGGPDGVGTIQGKWSIEPYWSGPFALRPVVNPDAPILVIE